MIVSDKLINVAGTTLTRPANTTAYTANDSISNNGTAGSVTALPATISDNDGHPVIITHLRLTTTDTALAAAVQVRAYVYDVDPTLNSGVGGGDNAAFSNKMNGFVGSFNGTFRAFADGGVAILTPDEGNFLVCNPGLSKQVWIQYQTLGAFTPSANSTTISVRFKGFQGRA